MKIIQKITVTTLSILLLASNSISIFAEEDASSKEEVIYVMSDASGKVTDVEAVNIFSGGNITDYGNYSAVKILNTTDQITQNGDQITFSSNADKVYYQGTMIEKNIPWNISIRYFLDGKEYEPKDIVGKDGALEIHFTVSENEQCEDSFYDDYALQASFTLNSKTCKNITTDGATVANVGSDKQLTYTILPGKGIDTVILADVTDFEMDSVAINGVRLNMNFDIDDAELMDKVDEIISAISSIDSGATEVNEGVGKLADATETLYSKIGELNAGVESLTSGAGELSTGLSSITEKNDQLISGAYTAYEGLCIAASTSLNVKLLENGMESVTLTPSNYSEVLLGLLQKMDADVVYNQAYQTALQQVTTEVEQQADTLYRAYLESQANAIYLAYISQQADTLYTQVATQMVYEQLIEKGYSEEQATAYLKTTEGQVFVQQVVSNMSDDQKTQILNGAVAQLTDEQKEQILQGAFVSLSEEQKTQIKQAYIQQMMVTDEVVSQINEAVSTVSESAQQVSNLKAQLDNYAIFYQGLLEYTSAVSNVATGANALKINMDTLYSNTGTLELSVGELNDAVGKLNEGTTDLTNGTSEFTDQTANMDTQISDEIDSMISSVNGGDSMVASFVSDKNTNVNAVQFVIKTEAIEKADTTTSETTTETTLNFFQKLLQLFGIN